MSRAQALVERLPFAPFREQGSISPPFETLHRYPTTGVGPPRAGEYRREDLLPSRGMSQGNHGNREFRESKGR